MDRPRPVLELVPPESDPVIVGNVIVPEDAEPAPPRPRGPPMLEIYSAQGELVFRVTFDPPGIELNQQLNWDGAAKTFWNAVHRAVGLNPPFGW